MSVSIVIMFIVVLIVVRIVVAPWLRMLHMGQSVIKDPMIVFLNLAGTDYETIAAEDRATHRPIVRTQCPGRDHPGSMRCAFPLLQLRLLQLRSIPQDCGAGSITQRPSQPAP